MNRHPNPAQGGGARGRSPVRPAAGRPGGMPGGMPGPRLPAAKGRPDKSGGTTAASPARAGSPCHFGAPPSPDRERGLPLNVGERGLPLNGSALFIACARERPLTQAPPAKKPDTGACPDAGTADCCRVRFLHCAAGLPALTLLLDGRPLPCRPVYAGLTPFYPVPDGFRRVAVCRAGTGNAPFMRGELPFRAGDLVTVAILNTCAGTSLCQFSEIPCSLPQEDCACLRAVNLVPDSPPLAVVREDGQALFPDLRFKEAASFRPARPGRYRLGLMPAAALPRGDIETLDDAGPRVRRDGAPLPVTFPIRVGSRTAHSFYILGSLRAGGPPLQILPAAGV